MIMLMKAVCLFSVLFKDGFVKGYCGPCVCCKHNQCDYRTSQCSAGCIDGYWGNHCYNRCPGTCVSCSQSYGNNYLCYDCAAGFYRGQYLDDTRQPFYWNCTYDCNQACQTCSSYHQCDACKPGFYLYNWKCNACPAGCSACTNYDTCTYCHVGYYLKERECHHCRSGCSSCTDLNKCNTCSVGYYLNGNDCSPCRSQCRLCSQYDRCTQCQTGYYWNRRNCVPCASDCSACSTYGERCLNCKDGYSLENGVCYSTNCAPKCHKCTSAGNCIQCEMGFYGPECLAECPSNCNWNRCDSSGRCYSCKVGFYGKYCSDKCPENCFHNNCKKLTGICWSCKQGFYFNANVCEKCPTNCEICSSLENCLSCVDGYKGSRCQNICLNCKHGTACHQHTGYCYQGCIQGLTGDTCENNCSKVCKTCNQHNSSICNECIENRFGATSTYYSCENSCSSNCLNLTCSDNTGHCTLGCVEGFWGKTCNKTCSNTCLQNKCDKEDGSCSSGCIGGYTGHHCKCPPNCFCDDKENCTHCKAGYAVSSKNCECTKQYCLGTANCNTCFNTSYYAFDNHCCACNLHCKNGKCASENQCLEGCEKGYYRHNCLGVCSEEDALCVECTTDNSGGYKRCIQCQQGFYPENGKGLCQHCPSHCKNSTCDSRTGICTQGCEPGWWGNTCSKSCAHVCGLCAQNDGNCTVCSGGKYLLNCSKNCSSNCSTINGTHVCKIEDGTCLYGCKRSSWYGKQCERRCSSTCTNQDCDWKTGHCLNGCEYNYYGLSCDNKCKDTCVYAVGNRRCFESNGTCVSGCPGGYYGLMCDLPCSKNCFNKTCDKQTGSCDYGCVDTFEGKTCESAQSRSTGHENTVPFAVGGSISAVLVIIAVLVVILLTRQRRRSKGGHDRNYMQEGSTAVRFSNNTASVIQQEQSDEVVYAKPNKPKTKMSEESMMARKSEAASVDEDERPPNNVHGKGSSSIDRPSVEEKQVHVYKNDDVRYTTRKSANVNNDIRESMYAVLEIDEDSIIAQPDLAHSKMSTNGSATDRLDEYAYYNVAAVKRRRVPTDKLADIVLRRKKTCFIEEFDKLPTGLIKSYTESQKRENIAKNRYRGLYPYDSTRVILNEGDSDYINASYIDGYRKGKAYIASIGPTLKYMNDMSPFWIMVWQEQVGKVVMLTKLTEAGVPKCDKYWPDKNCCVLCGDIQVTTNREEIYADYTVRSFFVQKDSKARNIVQVHFTAWPDKGIPDDTTSLIEFRQKVNTIKTKLDGPVLVHCSAGIGRTGTYIAIDSITHEGEAEGGVDIYACVRNLREQRVNMVQTAEQYQYLHNAVVHTLSFGSKPIKASKFHEYMSTLAINHLENQFQQLEAFDENRSDDEKEAVRLNKELKDQNRSSADIPGYNNRPRLYLRRKQGISGYINAVYINSFRTKNRFLVAQTPLSNTVEDFLTVIVQEKVSCIVALEPNLNGNKTVGTYYSDHTQPLKVGSCTVQSEQEECTDQYVQRKLKILHQGKSRMQEVTVTHIQLTKWIERQKTPDDPKMFMHFVKDVEQKCDGGDKERPILVHCLTGAEKSGLFCVVSILLEKIQLQQEISVVNTVRQVKNRRHKSIPNKEQYIFCHQCLDEYLKT